MDPNIAEMTTKYNMFNIVLLDSITVFFFVIVLSWQNFYEQKNYQRNLEGVLNRANLRLDYDQILL